jgi:hypothetical protein
LDQLRNLSGEVCEDEIRAGAFDGVEVLERNSRAIEPSVGRRALTIAYSPDT